MLQQFIPNHYLVAYAPSLKEKNVGLSDCACACISLSIFESMNQF